MIKKAVSAVSLLETHFTAFLMSQLQIFTVHSIIMEGTEELYVKKEKPPAWALL